MARSLTFALRRVRQTVGGFDNGPRLLVDMARQAVTGKPEEITFRTRDGAVATIPNRPGARVPVYEIFVEDEYRLDWFTADLGPEPVALDIGAHIGCFSVAFARRHPGARVDAYEASPSTAAYLQRNIADNHLGDRVHGNNLAVQAVAGHLELADNGAASGHNGVLHLDTETRRVTVPSVAMADVLQVSGRSADLVKMDTEGGEYDMVLGSQPGDWAGVRRVVMEYHNLPGHSWEELETFFDSAGLSLVHRQKFGTGLGMAWLSRDPLAPPA
ncbi:methyltransferase, FkbM family [Aeromicrobium marinum DSM 15272]|uniref:Methyltransferase, FkbM family n=1 Tax=Aeromicrobium marinum DSM 15272 TaxID=585531 RepID=E2SFH5_9ACTN|nr:FkbM family methyltransferase [Aeromicrobium marinum]EFQ82076.1 methyltransferase, FkbM family [Aeromicrobium marinum DSM 15272]